MCLVNILELHQFLLERFFPSRVRQDDQVDGVFLSKLHPFVEQPPLSLVPEPAKTDQQISKEREKCILIQRYPKRKIHVYR